MRLPEFAYRLVPLFVHFVLGLFIRTLYFWCTAFDIVYAAPERHEGLQFLQKCQANAVQVSVVTGWVHGRRKTRTMPPTARFYADAGPAVLLSGNPPGAAARSPGGPGLQVWVQGHPYQLAGRRGDQPKGLGPSLRQVRKGIRHPARKMKSSRPPARGNRSLRAGMSCRFSVSD